MSVSKAARPTQWRVGAVGGVAPLLAMLQEEHPTLKAHALTYLNVLVDQFWPQMSSYITTMYVLSP